MIAEHYRWNGKKASHLNGLGNFLFSKFFGNSIGEITDGRGFEPLLFHIQGIFAISALFQKVMAAGFQKNRRKIFHKVMDAGLLVFTNQWPAPFLRSKRALRMEVYCSDWAFVLARKRKIRSLLRRGRRAHRARFPTCGVIRVAGYSVVWDLSFPPPLFPLKSTKRSAAAISRSQRSFITGALRNILLSAGFPVTIHMIALEQTFVNGHLQKISLAAASESNRFYP